MTHKRENDKLDFIKIKNSAFWKMLWNKETLTHWSMYLCKHIPVYFISKIYKELSKVKKQKHKKTPNDPILEKKVWTDISAKKLHEYNELYEYMNINKLNQLYEHKAAQHYYPQGNAN